MLLNSQNTAYKSKKKKRKKILAPYARGNFFNLTIFDVFLVLSQINKEKNAKDVNRQ